MNDNLRRRRSLGRGLAALLGDDAVVAATGAGSSTTPAVPQMDGGAVAMPAPGASAVPVATLPITALRSGRLQPRRSFDDTALDELAASIRAHGVVQPILVRPLRDAGGSVDPARFEIVAGERRWRAAQKAQLHEVPVVVRALDDGETLQLGLIENVQRADLTPIEEAIAYRRLVSEFGHTQEDIAATLGKSRPHVANVLRLLDLPPSVQAHIEAGRLSAGHGRAMIGTPDPQFLAQHAIDRGLSVREVERLAARAREALGKGWDGKGLPPVAAKGTAAVSVTASGTLQAKSADSRALEQRLETALGVRVELRQGKGESSELVLYFRDFDQLDEAVRRLTRH